MAGPGIVVLRRHLPQITRTRPAALHVIHKGIVGNSYLQPVKRASYAGHQHCMVVSVNGLYTDGVAVAMGRLA